MDKDHFGFGSHDVGNFTRVKTHDGRNTGTILATEDVFGRTAKKADEIV